MARPNIVAANEAVSDAFRVTEKLADGGNGDEALYASRIFQNIQNHEWHFQNGISVSAINTARVDVMDDHAVITERNRGIMNKVVQALFVDRNVDGFAEFVSDEEYIQHNPLIVDGKNAALNFLRFVTATPQAMSARVTHLLVDGDLAVVRAQFDSIDGEPAKSIFDMFRIRDGKLVEHWDVMDLKIEPSPAAAA